MPKKSSKKKIIAHFEKEKIFDKIQRILDRANVSQLGLKFNSLNFIDAKEMDDDPPVTCTRKALQQVTENGVTVLKMVCIAWSDGKDHSDDPSMQ